MAAKQPTALLAYQPAVNLGMAWERSALARCPFHTYTASACGLALFPRTRESRSRRPRDWMPAYAGMTFYWRRTYETDIETEGRVRREAIIPSLFPGMDPYLQGYLWPDVHHRLETPSGSGR